MSIDTAPADASLLDRPSPEGQPRFRRAKTRTSLLAHSEPAVWFTGGALAVSLFMVIGLILLIVVQGGSTFWPSPAVLVKTIDGKSYLGEVVRDERYHPAADVVDSLPADAQAAARAKLDAAGGEAHRRLLRTGNFEIASTHHQWVSDFQIGEESRPPWALLIERTAWGNFYGFPDAFLIDGKPVATDPEQIWAEYEKNHAAVAARSKERLGLERNEMGELRRRENDARLEVRRAEMKFGKDSSQETAAQANYTTTQEQSKADEERIRVEISKLDAENARFQLRLKTADGKEKLLPLADIVRVYPPNRLSLWDSLVLYTSRWWEFLTDRPREANTEGGVFPAIWGTLAMTLIMSLLVVPFGVLAALYLREYAKAGPIISAVRIAINNLAGVPSIVFGVFGLGFFCYIIGGSIDDLFYSANKPAPTFGTGGILWASFTLALLTVPVVIVATEEALAAVPKSMREGSYGCGASKWQTIRRIVLPRAMPGIMTGMILAVARGAGEVAPLMLVGAVKIAPELPVDGVFPFVHLSRSFMHLGFHIYDVGFQSPNSEAARPMVYTTTLLLIGIIAALNLTAVWLRSRLRRRYLVGQF